MCDLAPGEANPRSLLTMSSTSDAFLSFPAGFVWGSATSSYQIEGAVDTGGRGPSIWDTFSAEDGRISDGSTGAVACDHYNRYIEDVALMKKLGLHAYRFSIAWPRVLPTGRGVVNGEGLDFYDRLVDELLGAGITPMPTLYHWDLPQALEDQNGWVSRDTALAFGDYVEVCVNRLGDRIDTWTTLNEPFVSANHGYLTGEHAPGRVSTADSMAAAHHLMLGHGLAGERIRSIAPDARLAIVLNFTPVEVLTNEPADVELAMHTENLENRWYIDPLAGRGYPTATADYCQWDRSEVQAGDLDLISAPIDLMGVNYYTRTLVGADELPADTPQNTMGWELHPPTLGRLLRWLRDEYDFPSYMITENGCPMPDDEREGGQIIDEDRLAFVRDHLTEVHSAIEDDCLIEGYLVWSLFDNFEWAWGYGPTFGIVEVDYDTLERRPKKSADWFSQAAADNGFALPAVASTYKPWVSYTPTW